MDPTTVRTPTQIAARLLAASTPKTKSPARVKAEIKTPGSATTAPRVSQFKIKQERNSNNKKPRASINRTPTNVANKIAGKLPRFRRQRAFAKSNVGSHARQSGGMVEARFGSMVANLVAKILRGLPISAAQTMTLEYKNAAKLVEVIRSHPVHGNYTAQAEHVYNYTITGTKTDPHGRIDVLLYDGNDHYHICEIKTSKEPTLAAHTANYKKYQSVSPEGVPRSDYSKHMIQLIEMIRSMREEFERKGLPSYTVTGDLLVVMRDNSVATYDADTTYDSPVIFGDDKVEVDKVLVSAKSHLLDSVPSHVMEQLSHDLGTLVPCCGPMSALGPQRVVRTSDGSVVAIWAYSPRTPAFVRTAILSAVSRYMFLTNYVKFD